MATSVIGAILEWNEFQVSPFQEGNEFQVSPVNFNSLDMQKLGRWAGSLL